MRYKNSLKRLGLFSVLGLAVLLDACKKPESGVGQNLLPPGDELFANAVDSTVIYTATIAHPTGKLRTDIYKNSMIGNYVDPVFGKVRTSTYMEFDLSSDLTEFPDSYEVTKVILNLVYFGREYGQKNSQNIVVNMLTEGFNFDSSYYTNSRLAYEPANLIMPGFEEVNPQSELAGLSVAGNIKSLSLRMKPELGEFLLEADSAQSSSLANFHNYFKGLRIWSQTPDAQAINYDLSDTQTKLSVFYDVIEPDTTYSRQYDFIISDSCKHYTRIDHLTEGTPIDNIASLGELDGTLLCYPQAGGSTAIKVNMNEVNWVREDPTTTINQAWLVLPYDTSGTLEPIEAFSAHYYDESGDLQVYAENGSAVFTQLRADVGYYYIDLTNFLQDYANGNHDITELLLLPQVVTLNAQRAIIHGSGYNSGDKTQNTRLLITYTN
ncbi:MAG: DUF4270 family protein [Flavobacteriales bacterium]